jgi:3-deoxy-D-manno-octulosonic acid kinase
MGVMHSAGDQVQAFRDAGGEGSIVFDPARLRQATPGVFDPAAHGEAARPVQGRGGRGAAWFVDGEFGAGVLRQYRRGGWAARASRDGYLWQGEARVRSFAEFRLLRRLQAFGLPVPAPIAACYQRRGWRYRAAILVERIAGARSMAAAVDAGDAPWATIGAANAACHRHGAHHADLNANNILLDREDKAWIIDWDRGRIEAAGPWQARVLDRLQRSLAKECATVPAARLAQGMAQLRLAHDAALRA